MAYTRVKTVNFGPSKGGLSTVGYTLTGGSRIASGVAEIGAGTGIYGATIAFADGFAGSILWDTGEASPAFAVDEENSPADVTLAPDALDAIAIGGGTLIEAIEAMAAVLAGNVVESENADASEATTTFKDFKDSGTTRVSATETNTSRTVTVS